MSLFSLDGHSFPFVKWSRVLLPLSAVLVVVALTLFGVRGLNFGIDFKGGTLIAVETNDTVTVGDIRDTMATIIPGDVTVSSISGAEEGKAQRQIRIAQGDAANVSVEQINDIRAALTEAYPEINILKVTSIGGQVSSELVTKGLMAVGVTLLLIGVYIWLRFEWQFSVGAVIALVHDVSLTIGLFALLQLTFDLNIVAAILTIIGYSLNDTVVVYDRIRENLRRYKAMPIPELIDQSMNDVLRRSVITSVTTLIALLGLYIFGGAELRGFTFAMIWGVLIGTYSSIFIAAPLLLKLNLTRRDDKPKTGGAFADVDA